jgi:hypothetical protein
MALIRAHAARIAAYRRTEAWVDLLSGLWLLALLGGLALLPTLAL